MQRDCFVDSTSNVRELVTRLPKVTEIQHDSQFYMYSQRKGTSDQP